MKIIRAAILLALICTASFLKAQDQTKTENKTMKTYLIERDMPGVSTLSDEQLQGASQKSNEVIKELGPGIEWVNSYVVDDKLYCVYRAESEDIIKEHAKKGGFPCTEIMEIKNNIGPETAKK